MTANENIANFFKKYKSILAIISVVIFLVLMIFALEATILFALESIFAGFAIAWLVKISFSNFAVSVRDATEELELPVGYYGLFIAFTALMLLLSKIVNFISSLAI